MVNSMPKGVVCNKCGGNKIEFRKSWKMNRGYSDVVYDVELWYCLECHKSFRLYREVE